MATNAETPADAPMERTFSFTFFATTRTALFRVLSRAVVELVPQALGTRLCRRVEGPRDLRTRSPTPHRSTMRSRRCVPNSKGSRAAATPAAAYVSMAPLTPNVSVAAGPATRTDCKLERRVRLVPVQEHVRRRRPPAPFAQRLPTEHKVPLQCGHVERQCYGETRLPSRRGRDRRDQRVQREERREVAGERDDIAVRSNERFITSLDLFRLFMTR